MWVDEINWWTVQVAKYPLINIIKIANYSFVPGYGRPGFSTTTPDTRPQYPKVLEPVRQPPTVIS